MRIYTAENDSDEMELTPLIDVVFLLLIFFLVATQFAQDKFELEVDSPEVTQAQPLSMTKEIVVNILPDRKGKYTVMKQEYDEKELQQLLIAAARKNPQQAVLINGHEDSHWKYGVRVMGLCNKAEITDYRVVATKK